jgi:hypothetical protein
MRRFRILDDSDVVKVNMEKTGLVTFSNTDQATGSTTASVVFFGGISTPKSIIASTVNATALSSNTLIVTTGSIPNLVSTYASLGNLQMSTLNLTTLDITNLTAQNIFSTTITTTSLLATADITTGNMWSSNQTTTNSVFTNVTVGGGFNATNASASFYIVRGLANTDATDESTGTLQIVGGAGITKKLYVGESVFAKTSVSSASLFSLNQTSSNAVFTNTSIGALSVTTFASPSISTGSLFSLNQTSTNSVFTNTSIGTLSVTTFASPSISTGSLFSLNQTSTNSVVTNASVGTLSVTTFASPSISTGSLFSLNQTTTNAVFTNTSTSTLNVSGITSGTLLVTTSISTGSVFNTDQTTTNAVFTNVTVGGGFNASNAAASFYIVRGLANTDATDESTGTLQIIGGAGITKKLYVGESVFVKTSVSSASLFSLNQTSTNSVFTNTSIGTLSVTTFASPSISSGSLFSLNQTTTNSVLTNASVGTLSVTSNVSSGSLFSLNHTSSNAVLTNASVGTLSVTTFASPSISTGSLYSLNQTSTNTVFTNTSISTLNVSGITSGTILATSSISTGSVFNTDQTTTNAVFTNVTVGGGFNASNAAASFYIVRGLANTDATDESTGTLQIIGGAGITKKLYVGESIFAKTSVSSASLFSLNQTSSNAVFTNCSIGTLSVTSFTPSSVSSGSLFSLNQTTTNSVFTNCSVSTLSVTSNVSSGSLFSLNQTSTNSVFTNTSIGTLSVTTFASPSISTGSLFSLNQSTTNTVFTNTSTSTLNVSGITSGTILATTSISTGSLFNTDQTTTNAVFTNVTVGGGFNATSAAASFYIVRGLANTDATDESTGTLQIIGGAGITKKLYVGESVFAKTSVSSASLFSLNQTSSNAVLTNASIGTLSVTSFTPSSISSGSLFSLNQTTTNSVFTNCSVGTLSVTSNVSSASLYGLNQTTTNSVLTNASIGTLSVTTFASPSISTGSLFSLNQSTTNAVFTNTSTSTLNVSGITSGTILATSSVSAGSLFNTDQTTTNAVFTNVTVGGGFNASNAAASFYIVRGLANTDATDESTGTLQIIGGAGITKKLYVGESIFAKTSVSSASLFSFNQTTTNSVFTNVTSTNITGVNQTLGKLSVFSSTQLTSRIDLTGQEYYLPSNTSTDGIALMLGVNRSSGNRQLWIGASNLVSPQSSTAGVLRVLVGGSTVTLNAIATDGVTNLPLGLGDSTVSNLVGTNVSTSTLNVTSITTGTLRATDRVIFTGYTAGNGNLQVSNTAGTNTSIEVLSTNGNAAQLFVTGTSWGVFSGQSFGSYVVQNAGTTTLQISTNGNTCVGSVESSSKLNVNTTTLNALTGGFSVWDSKFMTIGGNGSQDAAIGFGMNSVSGGSLLCVAPGVAWKSMYYNAYEHYFLSNGVGVGIGNTSPATTLDVTGTLRATTSITSAALYTTNQTTTNAVFTNVTVGGGFNASSASAPFWQLKTLSNTDATDQSTGSLQVVGGAGITKKLYVGGDLYVLGGTLYPNINTTTGTNFNINVYGGTLTVSGNIDTGGYSINQQGGNLTSTGNIKATNVTASSISISNTLSATFNSNTIGPIITTGGNVGIGNGLPNSKFNTVSNELGDIIGPSGAWDAKYSTFGGAGGTSGCIGLGYHSVSGGSILSLAPLVAWMDMHYTSNRHIFYATSSYKVSTLDFPTSTFHATADATTNDSGALVIKGGLGVNKTINTTNIVATYTSAGNLTKISGSFQIQHPLLEDKSLTHSFIEGPRCDLIYRGRKELENGECTVIIDTECTNNTIGSMTPGTFDILTKNPQVFLQCNTSFEGLIGYVTQGNLHVQSSNTSSNSIIDWMVIAERADNDIKLWSMTDTHGCLVTEHDH